MLKYGSMKTPTSRIFSPQRAGWRFRQDKFIIRIKGNKGNLCDCSFVNILCKTLQRCTGVDFMTDDNNNESKDFSPRVRVISTSSASKTFFSVGTALMVDSYTCGAVAITRISSIDAPRLTPTIVTPRDLIRRVCLKT